MLELSLSLYIALGYTALCYLFGSLFRWYPEGALGFGGGGGSQPTSTTSTTTQELAPQQKQLLDLVIPTATEFINNPPQLFPGSAIQGFTPLQREAQQGAVDVGRGSVPEIGARGAQANQFLTSGAVLDPRTNPGLRGAIEAAISPLSRQFTSTVLPNIRNEAVSAGGFGGSRQGIAEGLASQGFLDAAGNAAANVVNPAFQAGLSAFTQGIGNTDSLQRAQLLGPSVIGGVGEQQRLLGQQQLSEEAQRFLSEQVIPFSVAQDVAALAFGVGGGSSTTQSAGTGPDGGGGGDSLSTILGIAGLAASLFCWVAREVYGTDSPKWMLFRQWMRYSAPEWVMRFYLAHGEQFAAWISDRPKIKSLVRKLMDKAIASKAREVIGGHYGVA